MHAFDIMAEAKMRQWEKERKEGGSKPTAGRQLITVSAGESLEKQLYTDIKRMIAQAKGEQPEARRETLREAEALEVQLLARLERSGCFNLTKYLADEIRKLRTAAE